MAIHIKKVSRWKSGRDSRETQTKKMVVSFFLSSAKIILRPSIRFTALSSFVVALNSVQAIFYTEALYTHDGNMKADEHYLVWQFV